MTSRFSIPVCAALLSSAAVIAEAGGLDNGKKAYEARCASCHAKDGRGLPALAKAFKVPESILNLVDEESLAKPQAEFVRVAAEGVRKMPAHKGKLSASEIQAIEAYVRALAPSKGAAEPAAKEAAASRPAPALSPALEPAQQSARVVVVGGGLAGLVAAYELQNLGITAHILEANERWGGRIATEEYGDGLHADYGLREIWARDPFYEYAKKLNIPLLQPEQPYSSVVIDGKFYPYVQDSLDAYLATVFSPEERQQYAGWLKECEVLYDEAEAKGLTPRLAELQKISFAKWVESFKVTNKVSEFIRMGLECETATDWANVSAVYGILQTRLFLHGSELCYHAKGGNKTVVEAFVRAIKGPKTLGARVTRIVRSKKADGGTESVVYYEKDGAMRSILAEKVIVTVPYHMLHAIQMEPSLTEEQWKAVESLTPGMYTVVHLILDTEVNKVLLVNGKVPFPVLTRGPLGVVYGFLELPEPSQKKEVFSLLIHGEYTRTYLEPRDKIRESLLAEMDKIWPGFSKYVRGTYFYGYHPAATPSWPPGRSPIDSAQESLRQENVGLFLAGDYVYSGHAEGAVISGRETAKKIAAELTGSFSKP